MGYYSPIYLEIISPLNYTLKLGEYSGANFYTHAKLRGNHNSLHFFGTSREIENIEVQIYPDENKVLKERDMQLQFRGALSEKYGDYFMKDTEEYLSICLTPSLNQFELFFKLWELNNIEAIFLNLKKEIINGLYILDTLAPISKYKILPDRRMVKNHHSIPDNFSDFEKSDTYYVLKDCFNLTIRICKSFKKNTEHVSEIEVCEQEESVDIVDKDLEKIEDRLKEIKSYIGYLIILLSCMIVSILSK